MSNLEATTIWSLCYAAILSILCVLEAAPTSNAHYVGTISHLANSSPAKATDVSREEMCGYVCYVDS